MKICVVADLYPKLSETFINSQVEGLAVRGHEVEVLCRDINPGAEDSTVPIRRWWGPLSVLNGPVRLLNYRFGHKATKTLDQLNASYLAEFDVVLAHFGYLGARVASTLATMDHSPRLVTIYHGHDVATVAQNGNMSIYDELFREGTLHLPVSDYFRQILVDAGAPADRTQVHRMGISPRAFTFTPRDWSGRPLRILSVCRLTEKKGVTYAIAALERVAEARPDLDWHYYIIGTGELEEALRRQAAASRVAARITFLGALPHHEVKRVLKEADLFLLSSATAENGDAEGVPVSLMEAMASGVPVVSTWHSGIPELVEDGVTGFLAPEHDVDTLAAQIIAAAEHDDAERVARAAADKVQQEFNADHQLDELEQLLTNLQQSAAVSGSPTAQGHKIIR